MQDLPDELLLQIGSHFVHLNRNSDLARLAFVSRKCRNVAQEWLLKIPRFNLTHIDKYLWELAHHEYLQPQIRSLEIWSKSENRLPRDGKGRIIREYRPIPAPNTWNPKFVDKCNEIIEHFALDNKSKSKWAIALQNDCIPALLGVLICVLPNLKQLKLGNTWLLDFPMFSDMLSGGNASRMLPWGHESTFMEGQLQLLLQKLEYLDVSADMSCTWFHSRVTTTVFTFVNIKNLKEIGVTMRALWWRPSWGRWLTDPREIFPGTLEVVRISEANDWTLYFLGCLCIARKGGHFPGLRRVELYFMESFEAMEYTWDEVHDMQRMCKQAEISLYIYFPAHELKTWEVGCAPWSLREDRQAFQAFREPTVLRYKALLKTDVEAEFEMDGDAIMQV